MIMSLQPYVARQQPHIIDHRHQPSSFTINHRHVDQKLAEQEEHAHLTPPGEGQDTLALRGCVTSRPPDAALPEQAAYKRLATRPGRGNTTCWRKLHPVSVCPKECFLSPSLRHDLQCRLSAVAG